jgi:hypothetical protein
MVYIDEYTYSGRLYFLLFFLRHGAVIVWHSLCVCLTVATPNITTMDADLKPVIDINFV